MIVSSDSGITFMYRVGGIAVHDGRLLVERNLSQDFCFVPGGRVEYGENGEEALGRELREELKEEVKVGRLILVADILVDLDSDRFQNIALYFLIEFGPGSKVLDRDGTFEGDEPGTLSQWIPIRGLDQANLFPTILRKRVRTIPLNTEYVACVEPDPRRRSSS